VEGGVEITCGDSEPVVIHNGTNGTSASDDDCKITDDKDGVITLECSEGEYFLIKKLYKALCDGTPYNPETHFCYDDKQLLSFCNDTMYDPEKEFCSKRGDAVEGVLGKVKIGQQTWMAKNVNYETENSKCGGENETEEGDCTKYGRLYTWADAMGETAQGICPDGWHLPSKTDWERLIATVDSSDNEKNNAGLHLKANSALWIDYEDADNVTQSGAGDDTFSFTALPAGRYSMEKFLFSGEAAYFWSATGAGSNSAYYMALMNDSDEAVIGSIGKDYMFSVRCLQN
jgi:uncharacterized protein (TIGR02145 family)